MTSTTRVLAAALDLRTFTTPLIAATADVPANTVRSVLNRYKDYFTRTAAPTGKRGGQLQTWTLLPERREQLSQIVMADSDRESAVSIDHLILSDGRELSSAVGQRTRTPEAFRELVTEDELHQFDTYAASRFLPELVVRLVLATPGLTQFSMRIGYGVGYPSFDGRVETSTESFPVPSGYSVWELGAGEQPVSKANVDYNNRTTNPEDVDRANSTFVFVTSRRSSELEEWATAKRVLREWADVRAIDAQTLFKWLLKNRAVHVWASEHMGLHPTEVATLESWYSEWRTQTRPAIPHRLLVTGRAVEADAFREAALRSGETIGVISNSREESLAFVATVLLPEPNASTETEEATGSMSRLPADGRLTSALIVKTAAEWSRIVELPNSDGILIPRFDGADIAGATARGFTVVIPMGIGDDPDRATIKLPRIHLVESIEALKGEGVPNDDADSFAQAIDRSLTSFRRSHSVSPTYVRPPWANDRADLVAALTLLGSWNSDSEADHAVVSALARRNYLDVEQELQQLAAGEDAPFIASGNNWQLVSPEDAFALVGGVLTKGVLELWVKTALPVLREPDPLVDLDPEENFRATIKGVRRVHSSALRSGIARGAALLGASDRRLHGATSYADYARQLVRELLVVNPTASNWKTLADVLPLLAEAAPDEFLEGVRKALQGTKPTLVEMFTDKGPAPLFGGSSPHSHLLWALELIAQSEEFAPEALFQLAHLAEIDPDGRLSNRPAESLHRLLLVWYPQTAAKPSDRLRIVTQIVNKHPTVGWPLVLSLLPQYMDSSHRAYLPAFRDWHPSITVTFAEAAEAYASYASLALELATEDPSKWSELVSAVANLPVSDRDRYIDSLELLDPDEWTEGIRLANSRALSELIAKHRQFPTAPWVMPNEALDRLDAISMRWRPLDLVDRVSPLFMQYPDIPDSRRLSDHEAYQEQAVTLQRSALNDVLASDDPGALDRLVNTCPEPFTVGSTLADLAVDENQIELFAWLEGSDAKRAAIRGWLVRTLALKGDSWMPEALSNIGRLNEAARAFGYSILRGHSAVLDVVAADSPIVQSAFWSGRGLEFLGSDRQADIVAGLLAHDDSPSALEYLAYKSYREDIDPTLIITVLEAAAFSSEALNHTVSIHEIGQLLDKLEVSGAELSVLAQLELTYFPLLQHAREPRAFFEILGKVPEQFVWLVGNVFRTSSEEVPVEDEPIDPAAANLARISYSILRTWRTPPGASKDRQTIDAAKLTDWVQRARELLAEQDRVDIGDECIGQALSGSPMGTDGIWPAEPIRDLLETISSQHLIDGLAIGEFNARGATSRGPSEGGNQERGLSTQFEVWAAQVSPQWPATGRMLRELSRTYEKWAAREDAMSEQWRDER